MTDEHKKKWKGQSQQWRWTFRRKDNPMKNKTEVDILKQNIEEFEKLLSNITDEKNYWKNLYDELVEKTYMSDDKK